MKRSWQSTLFVAEPLMQCHLHIKQYQFFLMKWCRIRSIIQVKINKYTRFNNSLAYITIDFTFSNQTPFIERRNNSVSAYDLKI